MTDETTEEGALALNLHNEVPGGALVAEIVKLVESYTKAEPVQITDPVTETSIPALLTASGLARIPASMFDEYLLNPRFRRGVAVLTTIESFVDHVNRFKDAGTVVFANDDRDNPSLTAVLDYHWSGSTSAPRHGLHRAIFAFPLSDEWRAWSEGDGTTMTMRDFAAFLEDRIIDVMPPETELGEETMRFVQTLGGLGRIATPSQLIELSRGLQVHENAIIKEATKLSSGEGEVVFQTEHVDSSGAPLMIPTMFLIGIPVFRSGPTYQIVARLRYRRNGGQLVFWYDLWRTDRVFDHAFDEDCEKVRNATDCPMLFGAPEA